MCINSAPVTSYTKWGYTPRHSKSPSKARLNLFKKTIQIEGL